MLATLLATVAPTASAAPAQVTAPRATPAQAAPAFAPAAGAQEQGPRCAPDGPDHGGVPAVPPRTGGEHAQLPVAGVVPGEAGPRGTAPLRVLVRGPDRPAPGPVELSVLRV
ncbi:hypothetical protein ABZW32_24240 [Streptomyces sp. NPDC004667]|uniref:hypothetical protein n=1 Tax=Streptomyces sp. NPDC004667 TaxID=3154285 RepID=UPI0033B7BDCD